MEPGIMGAIGLGITTEEAIIEEGGITEGGVITEEGGVITEGGVEAATMGDPEAVITEDPGVVATGVVATGVVATGAEVKESGGKGVRR